MGYSNIDGDHERYRPVIRIYDADGSLTVYTRVYFDSQAPMSFQIRVRPGWNDMYRLLQSTVKNTASGLSNRCFETFVCTHGLERYAVEVRPHFAIVVDAFVRVKVAKK